ncbi:hypothetical protein J0S82_009123 [Galemys pyrenaicus]|uniref:Uncharacterized protein n=1 Tax=Galemys pyrenaicus TaxID=202257 RepID=A0A8J6A8S6_GALPY|nr:hypothetical protein J0S82_009123 [Galemys pyrenaicus]
MVNASGSPPSLREGEGEGEEEMNFTARENYFESQPRQLGEEQDAGLLSVVRLVIQLPCKLDSHFVVKKNETQECLKPFYLMRNWMFLQIVIVGENVSYKSQMRTGNLKSEEHLKSSNIR